MRNKILIAFLAVFLLAGCAAQGGSDAVEAVEQYYQAMVDRDDAALSNLTCAAWEEQALLEFDSFSGVEISLDGVTCRETGAEGDATLVTCDGKIVATYGNERMDFPLDERVHQVLNEAGDWRVCGY